jgi:hypothetical protein
MNLACPSSRSPETSRMSTRASQRDALGVRFRLEVEEPVFDEEDDREAVAA